MCRATGACGVVVIAIATSPATDAVATERSATTDAATTEVETAAPARDEWAPGAPLALDLSGSFGIAARLDAPPAFEPVRTVGSRIGMGAGLFLSRRFSLGVGYEHLDLGVEDTGELPTGRASLEHDVDVLLARLRLYLFRATRLGIYAGVGAGIAWQQVEAVGEATASDGSGFRLPFLCSGADSAGLALRGELGVDAEVRSDLVLSLGGVFDGMGLGDEVLDGCAPGAGSAQLLGLRSSLGYRFDL
jgi:hypothetical protein